MKFFTLLLFISLNTWAGSSITISGTVHTNMNLDTQSNVRFRPNYGHYLDYEYRAGKTKRKYFQYNESIDLQDKDLRKVTVYAP